jgi:hypothetical protein
MNAQTLAIAGAAQRPQPGWLAGVFTLDTRALAAMRMGLGCILLLNLLGLAGDAAAFFTDGGILSRADRMQLNYQEKFTAPPYWVSLQMLSGDVWFQYLLLAVAVVLAVAVIVGYRTSGALLGSWLLLTGLQARNPMLLHAGDDVLRCMLFWSIFLPLGAVWSLDRRRNPAAPPSGVCSVASAALLIQLICIYVFTGLLKSHPMWRSDFTALYYALALDHLTTPFGYALLQVPALLKFLTASTLLLELAGPVLLFCPWFRPGLRTAVVVAFWGLHLGIAATMNIGLFPWTCIVYWMVVLPSEFWDGAAVAVDRVGKFFGGGRTWHTVENMRFASPQANGRSGALLTGTSLMSQLLLAGLLVGVMLLNYVRLGNNVAAQLEPGPLKVLMDAAQLNQFWCMFSPRPHDFSGWYDLHGSLVDGTQVNLLHPELPPQSERPPLVNATYPNARWCKLLMTVFERDCPTFRRGVGSYLCRHWNATHGPGQQLTAAEIVLVQEPIVLPDALIGDERKASSLVLWRWQAPATPPAGLAQSASD